MELSSWSKDKKTPGVIESEQLTVFFMGLRAVRALYAMSGGERWALFRICI
jgi:hypothetical protein